MKNLCLILVTSLMAMTAMANVNAKNEPLAATSCDKLELEAANSYRAIANLRVKAFTYFAFRDLDTVQNYEGKSKALINSVKHLEDSIAEASGNFQSNFLGMHQLEAATGRLVTNYLLFRLAASFTTRGQLQLPVSVAQISAAQESTKEHLNAFSTYSTIATTCR